MARSALASVSEAYWSLRIARCPMVQASNSPTPGSLAPSPEREYWPNSSKPLPTASAAAP